MTTRTLDDIRADVRHASVICDTSALLRYAEELDAIATPDASMVASMARGTTDLLQGNYAVALEHYHRALATCEELGNRVNISKITSNIGIVYFKTGNYPAALEHYHRALAVHEELGNRRAVADVTANIGMVYGNTGSYPLALEHYHRAMAVLDELGNHDSMGNVSGSIGGVYLRTGDYARAREHFQHALDLYEQRRDHFGIAGTLCNIGNAHEGMGDVPTALEHYQRALTIAEEHLDRDGMARAIGNIGSSLIVTEQYAEAEALLLVMDAMQIDNPGLLNQREIMRASIQRHTGEFDAARTTLHVALEVARRHDLAGELAETHKVLRDLALKQNDLAGYVEHNNEYTRITEEINGKDTATKLAMQAKQREIDAKDREHQKHMAVLHSTLPKHVAERVARGEVVNDHFDNASVIFLDIVGFTELSSTMSSQDVITLLDTIFSQCDAICEQHNVVKIKTIGDSYMCVSFDSVINAARCALDFLHITSTPLMVQFRIGIHAGPLTAGVIGTQRMQYDVWGDTVNVASRMESTGEPGRIHVSQAFAENLEEASTIKNQESNQETAQHTIKHRGEIDIKGKGLMKTYWLEHQNG